MAVIEASKQMKKNHVMLNSFSDSGHLIINAMTKGWSKTAKKGWRKGWQKPVEKQILWESNAFSNEYSLKELD